MYLLQICQKKGTTNNENDTQHVMQWFLPTIGYLKQTFLGSILFCYEENFKIQMFPMRSFIFEEGKIEQTHCSDSHVEMWFLWFCLHTEKAVGGAHSEGSWGKKVSTFKNEKVVTVGSYKALQMLNLQNHFCFKK